ncbi:prephenate dehydratase [Cytophagales bacterium LB-30]|uniref:Bifunctional chorismate mutase/prephenate dehydratase n=1 Tax=Shiella aurantiaca TaxID=3058365 RepID=A0ABT8F484_9BACT|nr:prephenate dehydratase [Shiella aurantiaca]MDN4165283.1 prephenate dehydratase [Shiella aurantiaca]
MTLDEIRAQIDAIDSSLLALLEQRMDWVKKVGDLKKSNQTLIYRPEREKAIIERLSTLSEGKLSPKAIEAIFLEIFAVSRHHEMPERVAYLGPEGSFTHQAAESRFGTLSDYVALPEIRSVFEAVSTERVRFGVVPIENNQAGSVVETIDCLSEFDLHIAAEHIMPIHFCLASNSEKIQDIKRIYSKDIAFRQCGKFLKEMFPPDITLVPVASTSQAVLQAKDDKHSAALCAPVAAKIHLVPILFENIEDSELNQTRFLILAKDFENQLSGNDTTSIIAKLPDTPGSLARFLDDFVQAGISLSKIESRPLKGQSGFSYQFIIDFEGHKEQNHVKALLKKHENHVKWLGSFVKSN